MPRTHDKLLEAANVDPSNPEAVAEFLTTIERARIEPELFAAELVRTRMAYQAMCETSQEMQQAMKDLVEANARLAHLIRVDQRTDGRWLALCRFANNETREFPVHPDVDADALMHLRPTEYVRIVSDVVVGICSDDPVLRESARGDIVELIGYVDGSDQQVRVRDQGTRESIVTLAPELCQQRLTANCRLVLHRENPRFAIDTIPAARTESPFELPMASITRRLEDLAGIEAIARPLIESILTRIISQDTRDRFGLDGMNGALLVSRKPGTGKTTFAAALTKWLHELGQDIGFDVIAYLVKPNQLKNKFVGESSRIVREDLFGVIRQRQKANLVRPLLQIVVFDEVDSLQTRAGHGTESAAMSVHTDELETLLSEMDGIETFQSASGISSHVLCIGCTNRLNRLDDAARRAGRFGDYVATMPEITCDVAESIMAVYARGRIPLMLDGELLDNPPLDLIRRRFLRPAVRQVFPMVVARYNTESQRGCEVTAGALLSGVHYKDAMTRAKQRAASRYLRKLGSPAIEPDDIFDGLLDVACAAAEQMHADPQTLAEYLTVNGRVVRVDAVPKVELEQHRHIRIHTPVAS